MIVLPAQIGHEGDVKILKRACRIGHQFGLSPGGQEHLRRDHYGLVGMACHGPAGEGNPLSGYPALAGQQAVYTSNLLTRFRSGENWGAEDAPSQVMTGAAAELSDEEIAAVASYIQGLYYRAE